MGVDDVEIIGDIDKTIFFWSQRIFYWTVQERMKEGKVGIANMDNLLEGFYNKGKQENGVINKRGCGVKERFICLL